MAVKIRLQRKGKKGKPYFHIVVADARAPRDGRYIERLGMYNPNTDPATIEIDVDNASAWLQKGAQPTDTARAILSYRGVLYRNHLNRGVLKGALSQEDADKKFEAWVKEKDAKVQAKIDRLANESDADRKARLDAEAEVNKKRAAEIAAKNTPPEPEEAPAAEGEAPAAEGEAPAAEVAKADAAAPEGDQPSDEVKAEAAKEEPTPIEKPIEATQKDAEEVQDKVAEEVKDEAPKAEEKKEEATEAKADEKPAEEDKKDEAKAKSEDKPAAEEKKEEAKADEKPAKEDKKEEAEAKADDKPADDEKKADDKSEDKDAEKKA